MTQGLETDRGTRTRRSALIAPAWLAVGLFWLVVTRKAHPTLGLALVVTTSLVLAYAIASTVNLARLVPSYWSTGRYPRYWASLLAVMASLTALALAVIRVSFHRTLGPDPDPYGLCRHYAIDFFGMIVHVAASALVARGLDRWPKNGSSRFAVRADNGEGMG